MHLLKVRSSHPEVFCKKGVLRKFAKLTVKHLFQSLFINIVAGKSLWHRCFPVNFAKFLRTPFLTEHLRRPLLFCILILKKCISRTYMPYMYVYNCISRNYGNCGYFVKASWKNRKNFLKILRISE